MNASLSPEQEAGIRRIVKEELERHAESYRQEIRDLARQEAVETFKSVIATLSLGAGD